MPDTRCGLSCAGCTFKESHGCGGCVKTMGHPFHGSCPIALCCQGKGLSHCGECSLIPCNKLYAYSYLDPEHGDKPQGARVETCRRWAAETGTHDWRHVLLTSAGWGSDSHGGVSPAIRACFLTMLGKKAEDARVLFIPAAAIDEGAKKMAVKCRDELLEAGIRLEHITTYDLSMAMCEDDAFQHDVIYFTGGDTAHLLQRLTETGFNAIVKKMVYANKVYVGVSAGSLIATPNIGDPYDKNTAGLALVNAYLSVHCPPDTAARNDLPLPHVPLSDVQALAVSWEGYEVITG